MPDDSSLSPIDCAIQLKIPYHAVRALIARGELVGPRRPLMAYRSRDCEGLREEAAGLAPSSGPAAGFAPTCYAIRTAPRVCRRSIEDSR